MSYLTIIQLAVTWILVGIMWFSQIVHYPLYRKIKEGFVDYERGHIERSAFLFSMLMVIEAVTVYAHRRGSGGSFHHACKS